jgi:hypothetical protein
MKNFFTTKAFLLLSGLFMISIYSSDIALAATTPALGQTASYGILSSTYSNTSVTTITGSIGFTTGPAVTPLGVHTTYGSSAPYATAGVDQGGMLTTLNGQPCTFTFPAGAVNLSTDITHGTAGIYTPGVYCSVGAMNIGGPLTLSGTGTYIFRAVGALTSTTGSVITLAGASACDIFWTPSQATTLANNTNFSGTVIDNAGITVGANTTWAGAALAFGGTITTDTDTLSVPSCVTPPVPTPPVVSTASTGGVYSMPWVTPLISVVKVPTPLALPDGPGSVTYNYTVTNIGAVILDKIRVTDDTCAPVVYVSGDENGDGKIARGGIWKYRCTMNLNQTTTNIVTATGYADFATATDTARATVVVGSSTLPPIIHIVKTANLYSLPSTGGWVAYTYVVTNPGTVALSDVNVTDDKCTGLPGRVSGHPGDLNKNDLLESSEVWSFTCLSFLTKTTTNTATAIGHANGLTATDYAVATVTVVSPQAPVASIGFPNAGIPPRDVDTRQISVVSFAIVVLLGIGYGIANQKKYFNN